MACKNKLDPLFFFVSPSLPLHETEKEAVALGDGQCVHS